MTMKVQVNEVTHDCFRGGALCAPVLSCLRAFVSWCGCAAPIFFSLFFLFSIFYGGDQGQTLGACP